MIEDKILLTKIFLALANLKLCFWSTVTYIESGTPMFNWDFPYLRHFSTEIAEIWSPGTFFKDVWAYKISAQNLLYFQSYEISHVQTSLRDIPGDQISAISVEK